MCLGAADFTKEMREVDELFRDGKVGGALCGVRLWYLTRPIICLRRCCVFSKAKVLDLMRFVRPVVCPVEWACWGLRSFRALQTTSRLLRSTL